MNARMYDEDMPTFLSLDPASQYNPSRFLHDPQQLNLYAYARGNPVRYNDPSGEATYMFDNGLAYEASDFWDKNTYYEYSDSQLLENNASIMRSGENYANLNSFYSYVHNKSEWDYKNQNRSYYFFENKLVGKEDFGNINFGYAGTAGGFNKTILKIGAGYAQLKSGNAKAKDLFSFFDDPKDMKNINSGIKSYNYNHKKNTANISTVLKSTVKSKKIMSSVNKKISSIRGYVNSIFKKLIK
jgi:hypothetical protein